MKSLQLNANDVNDACEFLFDRMDLVDAAIARENAQKEVWWASAVVLQFSNEKLKHCKRPSNMQITLSSTKRVAEIVR